MRTTILPWVILGFILSVSGAFVSGELHGRHVKDVSWTAKLEKDKREAVETALTEERRKHKEVVHVLQNQNAELQSNYSRYVAELDELRKRPARSSLPADSRAQCQGSTGAELSREDGEFLTGEATRGDNLRAGLRACYEYVDRVCKVK